MSKKKDIAPTRDGYRKELMDLLRRNSYSRDLHRVFSDFVEMSAIALSNSVDLNNRDEREARYIQIVGQYDKEEVIRIAHAFGALTLAMEAAEFDDVLGSVYMELELANKSSGQFFTPYSLSYLMAELTFGDGIQAKIERSGFITANDPAVGGGAMPIALANVMFNQGFNHQKQLHVIAQDVDIKAVHMTYVQLSMLHVPAMVIHGNTLTGQVYSHWYTPAHILGGWNFKLRNQVDDEPMIQIQAMPTEQIDLFQAVA
jgi:type I restriction-modification system DNA methylase subunit